MWGGFGAALSKAAALANQTIQDLDREAGLVVTDTTDKTAAVAAASSSSVSGRQESSWNDDEEDDNYGGDGWKDGEEEVEEEDLDDVERNDDPPLMKGGDVETDEVEEKEPKLSSTGPETNDSSSGLDSPVVVCADPVTLEPPPQQQELHDDDENDNMEEIIVPIDEETIVRPVDDERAAVMAESTTTTTTTPDSINDAKAAAAAAAAATAPKCEVVVAEDTETTTGRKKHNNDLHAAAKVIVSTENGAAKIGAVEEEMDYQQRNDSFQSCRPAIGPPAAKAARKNLDDHDTAPAALAEDDCAGPGGRNVNPRQIVGSPAVEEAAQVEMIETVLPPVQQSILSKPTNDPSCGGGDDDVVQELRAQLAEREGQLLSKTQQLRQLEEMYAAERQQLLVAHEKEVKKVKEEAKRRLATWRERVEATDALSVQLDGLREEGAKMARREADANEKAKRARHELKDMVEDYEATKTAEAKARQKIADLEMQLKTTHEELQCARKGESQAGKLDVELREAREMSEKRAAVIIKLEHELKVLKAANTELDAALKNTERHAAVETEEERKRLVQEKHDITSYWQTKLKVSEDEAEQREVKLRKAVDELRKSLNEAERRAHSTASSDVLESHTIPLLRKLEEAEARHRKRASEWAETEVRLRQDVATHVAQMDEVRSELAALQKTHGDLDKTAMGYQSSIQELKVQLASEIAKTSEMEIRMEKLQEEISRRKKDYERLEVSANENGARIRSDLHRALQDAEETLSSVRNQLQQERDARAELEQEMNHQRQNGGSHHNRLHGPAAVAAADQLDDHNGTTTTTTTELVEELVTAHEAPKQRIRKSEGQAEILAGALGGLMDDDDDSDADSLGGSHPAGPSAVTTTMSVLQQSELAKRTGEVKELRTRLKGLEEQNSQLLQILGESRSAREELPEALRRLDELARDNEQLRQENQALQEDLVDVRQSFLMTIDQLTATSGVPPDDNKAHPPHQDGESQ